MTDFASRDPGWLELLHRAERVARSQAAVLLSGETGTGKNRLARFLHDRSPRSAGPFVEVTCANLPPELIESTLFGHDRGAFTDARFDRPGRFELAHGGTIHLDEIQEIDPALQAKVLRAVEEKRFERLGGGRTREVDVRVVASTGADPDRLVREGRLRPDLYYRMSVVRLHLPALRDRPADIPLLAREFLDEAIRTHGLPVRRLAAETIERVSTYPWPGNVRELKHAIESSAVLASGDEILIQDLPPALSVAAPEMVRAAAGRGISLRELESAYIQEVLERTRGNKSEAARILGIHRKTLHEKLRSGAGREDR